jgi:hypothetical protein
MFLLRLSEVVEIGDENCLVPYMGQTTAVIKLSRR